MIFWLLLFLAVLLEGVLTTLPLVLILLVVLYVLKKGLWLFIAAFFTGVILDLILVRTIGTSSLFFVSFLFLEELYGRKFETQALPFVLLASFVGSIFYLLILGQTLIFQQSLVSSIMALGVFKLLRYSKL